MNTLENIDMVLSERLVFRKFTMDDANDVFEYSSDDSDTNKYMEWQAHTDVSDSIAFLREIAIPNHAFCIEYSGKCIGCIELRPLADGKYTFGYILNRKFRNLHFMSEALKTMLGVMFEQLGATEVIGKHAVSNKASGRVMERNGMKVDRILPAHTTIRTGETVDVRQLYMTRKDYFELYKKN